MASSTRYLTPVTRPLVAAPAPSTSVSAVVRLEPVAVFQWDCSTTPAFSSDAIVAELVPTKSIPIGCASALDATGTIWMPFTGARRVAVAAAAGAAVNVNPSAVTGKNSMKSPSLFFARLNIDAGRDRPHRAR